MEIHYELTKPDFTEAYTAHHNRSTVSKWARRLFIGILVAVVALVFLGFLVKPSAKAAKDLVPFFGIVAMWIVVLWFFPRWMMGRQFTKQPGAQGLRTLMLDARGAHWKWNGGSSDVEWKNYIRSVEGKGQILMYTSPACFNILPKRAVGDEQLLQLRNLLQQNIKTQS